MLDLYKEVHTPAKTISSTCLQLNGRRYPIMPSVQCFQAREKFTHWGLASKETHEQSRVEKWLKTPQETMTTEQNCQQNTFMAVACYSKQNAISNGPPHIDFEGLAQALLHGCPPNSGFRLPAKLSHCLL